MFKLENDQLSRKPPADKWTVLSLIFFNKRNKNVIAKSIVIDAFLSRQPNLSRTAVAGSIDGKRCLTALRKTHAEVNRFCLFLITVKAMFQLDLGPVIKITKHNVLLLVDIKS